MPVVIFVPPAAPSTIYEFKIHIYYTMYNIHGTFAFPVNLSMAIVGAIEETQRLPPLTKFIGLGGTPKSLLKPVVEKSSMPSLKVIPVRRPRSLEPKYRLTVVVTATACPFLS